MSEQAAPEAAEPEPMEPDPAETVNEAAELPAPEHPRRRIPRAALGVTILVVLLAGISVAVFLVSSGPGSSKGAPASAGGGTAKPSTGTGQAAAADAGATPGPQPGTTAIPGTPVAAVTGPKPIKPTDPAKVKSWNIGKGGAALAQVTAYSGNVLMAYGSGLYPQTLQGCLELARAVKKAEALPPIPSSAMQKMYVRSLDAFNKGIAECEAAITQHPEGVEDTVTDVNHNEMNKAIAQFSTGTTDLYIATEFLRNQ